jgi:hypothetical protein
MIVVMQNDRQVGIELTTCKMKNSAQQTAHGWPHRGETFMVRIRHCLECPTCRLRYVISLNPYNNGSHIITAVNGGQEEYLLYCACRRGASRWIESDVLLCDVSREAYERGYGTPAEIWCPRPRRGMDESSRDTRVSMPEIR